MAIVSGYPKLVSKRYEVDQTQRRHIWLYRVVVDSINDGARVACEANGIPQPGSPNPDDSYAVCRTITAEGQLGDNDQYNWMVTVIFTTPLSNLSGAENQNPLLRPYEYSTGSLILAQALRFADFLGTRKIKYDGSETTTLLSSPVINDVIRNSAGDVFDPLPEDEVYLPWLRITRNEPYDVYALMEKKATYENKVNADAFGTIAAPGYARMGEISGQPAFENGFQFFRVTYQIQFTTLANGFNIEILDEGFHEKAGPPTDVNTKKIILADGTEAASPQPLDGTGYHISPATSPPAASDIIAAFRIYRKSGGSINFAPLGLI